MNFYVDSTLSPLRNKDSRMKMDFFLTTKNLYFSWEEDLGGSTWVIIR